MKEKEGQGSGRAERDRGGDFGQNYRKPLSDEGGRGRGMEELARIKMADMNLCHFLEGDEEMRCD